VLIARVRELAPEAEIEERYDAINAFEAELVDAGTTVVKCMLHISPDTQKERLLARLDDPTKHWKFNPGDVDERSLWSRYQQAYEVAVERTPGRRPVLIVAERPQVVPELGRGRRTEGHP
jgi:polyphosphate kinase 2 (PPK2 family)